MTDVTTADPTETELQTTPHGAASGAVPSREHTASEPELAEPGERGKTSINDAVVEHVAARAATDVRGVARVGSGLDSVMGRRYPRAHADVAGDRARVHIDIAVTWPHPLSDVCAQVRDAVSARVGELTGLTVDRVDVTAAKVVHNIPSAPTRRVQ